MGCGCLVAGRTKLVAGGSAVDGHMSLDGAMVMGGGIAMDGAMVIDRGIAVGAVIDGVMLVGGLL